jgi:Skp family chaperone for outer membrane proteins
LTSVKDIRAAIDAGLDKLQAKAEAAAAQLDMTADEIYDRINEQEKKLSNAAEKLQDKLNQAVPEETRTKIQAAVEHLQVQMALGAADTRDAYNAKKKEVTRAIAELNAELDAAEAAEEREMAAELDALMEAYVAEAVALSAELEAMEEKYESNESQV